MHCGFKGSDQAQPVLCEFQAKPPSNERRPATFRKLLRKRRNIVWWTFGEAGGFQGPNQGKPWPWWILWWLERFEACNKQSQMTDVTFLKVNLPYLFGDAEIPHLPIMNWFEMSATRPCWVSVQSKSSVPLLQGPSRCACPSQLWRTHRFFSSQQNYRFLITKRIISYDFIRFHLDVMTWHHGHIEHYQKDSTVMKHRKSFKNCIQVHSLRYVHDVHDVHDVHVRMLVDVYLYRFIEIICWLFFQDVLADPGAWLQEGRLAVATSWRYQPG